MDNKNLTPARETSHPITGLRGRLSQIPCDKSIAHRACILSSLAKGETTIYFSEAVAPDPSLSSLEDSSSIPGDVKRTLQALEQMGASLCYTTPNSVTITGLAEQGGLQKAHDPIDLGNSGTAARLLMGVIGSYPIEVTLTGDASLTKRPMKRAMLPLKEMGVKFFAREDNYFPMTVTGNHTLSAIDYTLPVPSAQVKTAILLAAIRAKGISTVIEPTIVRDHTEKILPAFGCKVNIDEHQNGRMISVVGMQELISPKTIEIPKDFSAASFAIVAALITEQSDIVLEKIGINPTRTGLLDTLIEMGGDIILENKTTMNGEQVADIRVRSSKLKGVRIPETRVSLMIDEFPILAVAASFAEGTSHFSGLAELRVKESDRLQTTYQMLQAAGVHAVLDTKDHKLTIEGSGAHHPPQGGGVVEANFDHRIAMSTLVLGMASQEPMAIHATTPPAYASSFPHFDTIFNAAGANICSISAQEA